MNEQNKEGIPSDYKETYKKTRTKTNKPTKTTNYKLEYLGVICQDW